MTHGGFPRDPVAPAEERLRKLEKINRALMSRVERSTDFSGNGFSLFQTAILLEGQPGAPDQKAWPWPEVKTAEFVNKGDPNAMPLPARVMTAAQIEALGITPFEGGFVGLPLAGPGDGKFYTLSVRPLLPDDAN